MDMSDFEIIHTYTRKQALEDGVLIDVTEQAKDNGFKVSVAITCNLYNGYVVPDESLTGLGQSIEGRLHDLFEMTKASIYTNKDASRAYFEVLFLMKPNNLEKVKCLAIIGPDDNFKPCITLMLPGDE